MGLPPYTIQGSARHMSTDLQACRIHVWTEHGVVTSTCVDHGQIGLGTNISRGFVQRTIKCLPLVPEQGNEMTFRHCDLDGHLTWLFNQGWVSCRTHGNPPMTGEYKSLSQTIICRVVHRSTRHTPECRQSPLYLLWTDKTIREYIFIIYY